MPVHILGPGVKIACGGREVGVEEVAAEAERIAGLLGDPGGAPLLTLLRRLGRYPTELQFDAPTRRPSEPVTSGIEPAKARDDGEALGAS